MLELPGYEIVERIGRSSMTDVWKAYQASLQRYVTVKILREEFASDPEEVKRFFAEARQTSSLKHPGILQIVDADVHSGRYFVVMEFIAGPSVDRLIAEKGPLPPRWSFGLAARAATALGYAWDRHRLVHRNLTPRSLYPNGQGSSKLAYIGLSLRVSPGDGNGIRPGMIVGTPYYMSPEQACCAPDLDFRADMYSLGATLYHMVTGRMPFEKYSPVDALRRQVEGQLHHPCHYVEGLPMGIPFVIRKLMVKDPAHRYGSWDEAAHVMKKLAAGGVLVAHGAKGNQSTVADLRPARRAARPARQPEPAHLAHPRLRRIPA